MAQLRDLLGLHLVQHHDGDCLVLLFPGEEVGQTLMWRGVGLSTKKSPKAVCIYSEKEVIGCSEYNGSYFAVTLIKISL